jgi:spore germination protein
MRDSIKPFLRYHYVFRDLLTGLIAVVTGALAAFIVFYAPQYAIGSNSVATMQNTEVDTFSAPLALPSGNIKKRSVVGFLPYWAINNKTPIHPEYVDQLIYFGVTLDKEGNVVTKDLGGNVLQEWLMFTSPEFAIIKEQAKNTGTKVSVAIKNFDNSQIDTLISNPSYRSRAIANIRTLVTQYELDGVNIDFEYFTVVDFPTMQYLNKFLTELDKELREEKNDIIISFDVNASAVYADNAYDMVKIGEIMDQVIVMGYDYHRATSTQAGPVAPLDSTGDEPSIVKTITSLEGRVPKEKLILGIPLYGYEWQTISRTYRSKTLPETGAVASYKRVRELIESRDDVSLGFDDLSRSPWLTYTQNGLIKQIYYEDEKSLAHKIAFIHEHNLSGVALWALGFEGSYFEPWRIIQEGMWYP